MDDNKRKLYDALSQDYDMGSYEQFSNDVKDEGKRRKLYDAIKEEYDLPDFDGFSSQLLGGGANADNARQTSQQRVNTKPQPKPQAKPKQPLTPPNPNLYDMLDAQRERDQHMNPQFQTKVVDDGQGHRVRIPKVEQRPIYNGSPQVSPVIKDTFGNEYDATDPETLQQAKKQVKQLPKTEEEERAKWQRDKDMQNDPSLKETIGKSVAAGFTRVGAGLVDALNWMMSGSYVYKVDPKTGQLVVTTPSYTERAQDKDLMLTKASNYLNEKADKMSKESQPYGGQKGFVDLLWNEKDFGAALQKGVSVAGESLPMTLSWANPYTAALNAVSMAGTNMRNETLENPDVPEWKRGAYAIGQAAIEQAVEKWSDPFFKYVGGAGTRILKGAGKEASKEIVQKTTKEAVDNIAKRIYHRLGDVAKDAAGEGAEEIVGNFGNDLLGEALDRINGIADYGIEAQWKEIKEKNPDANLMDFAEAKAKEYTDAFLGGAMAGAYTAGSTMTSIKALEYASKMPTKKGDKIDPITLDVAQSFDEGYAEDDSQAMNDAKNRYELQRQRISEVMGEDGIATFDENPVQALASASQNDLFTDEQKQIMIDYVNSKAAYDGMTQRVRDDIDSRIAESDAMISDRVHEDGMIHPATMKVDNRQVYIVGGNVVMNEDGTMVDREKSDESVIIRDAETGEIEFADPRDIFSIDDTIDAEEEATTAREAIRQQFAQDAANKIEGKLPFNVGDIYNVVDDEGQPHSVSILPLPEGAINVQGAVFASIDGQEPTFIWSDKVQRMAGNANLARLQQEEEQRAAAFAERQADFTETPENYAQNQQEIIPETAEQQPEVSDAMPMIGEGEEAEPDFTSVTPERGHKYLYNEAELTRDEANQFVAANKKAAEDALKKITDKKPKMGTSLAKYRKEITTWEGEAQKAQTSVDYWNAIAEKQSQIEKAEDEAWFKQSTEDAAGRAAVIDEQKNQKQQIEAAKKMYGSYFDDDMEVPQDINELIAMNLPKGISWEGHDDVKGIMQEAGFKKRGTNGSSDTKPFNSYLAKKGEGIGFDDAVHSVYESPQNQLEGGEHRFDTDEIRNALIDMFASANGTGYFENYVLNNRIAQAEKNRQAEDDYKASLEAADNAIIQATGMTDSDYNDWIESLESMVAEQNGQNKDEYFNNNNNEGRTEINASGSTAEGASAVQGQESVETPAQANGSAGTATDGSIDNKRESLRVFFDETGVDVSLADKLTDDEVNELTRLIEAWEVVNDEYGQVQEQMQSALKSKNKAEKENAEKIVKEAQQKSIEASKPAEEYIRNAAAKYGIRLDDDMAETAQTESQPNSIYEEAKSEIEKIASQLEDGNSEKNDELIQQIADMAIDAEQRLDEGNISDNERTRLQAIYDTAEAWLDENVRGGDKVDTKQAIAAAEAEVNTEPTEAQKEAGNYKMGHVTIDGLDITIENPKGSTRSGKDASGKEWSQVMHNTYGYIRGTEGVDGDHIDVFLSDEPEFGDVYVVDQVNKDGSFDEHKVMYGFPDMESAKKAYLSNYEEGWQGLGAIAEVSKDEFKKWIESSHRKTKPFSEYKSVKTEGDVQLGEGATQTTEQPKGYELSEFTKGKAVQGLMNVEEATITVDGKKIGRVVKTEDGYYAETPLMDWATDTYQTANEAAQELVSHLDNDNEGAPVQDAAYTIEPTTYTNKKGKETPMHLVKFNNELTKEQIAAGKVIAKESKGWWDREQQGFMMRSEESAKALADKLSDNEEVADAQPLSAQDMANVTTPKESVQEEPKELDENEQALALFNDTKVGDVYANDKGFSITIDKKVDTEKNAALRYTWTHHVEDGNDGKGVDIKNPLHFMQYCKEKNLSKQVAQETAETKPSEPKRLVSDSRMEELKERMRKKLGGQMNMGVDPEILAIGAELAVGYIERGATKFADYAKQMVGDLGDTIRPYLKSFYNAVRDMPEAESYVEQMDSYDDVRLFDVANFDKANTDAMAAAAEVVAEQEAEKQAEEGKAKLTEQRNTQRKEQEKRDSVAEDGTPLRKATTEDFDTTNRVYRHGKPYGIILLTRKGEQVDALHFSKPEVTSVMLHDGSYADISELWVPDVKPALQNTSEPQKTEKKPKKSSKKSVNSQQMPDLFSGMYEVPAKEEKKNSGSGVELVASSLPEDKEILESSKRAERLSENKRLMLAEAITERLVKGFTNDIKAFSSINELRELAREYGFDADTEGRDDILLQEIAEDAIVHVGRRVVESGRYGEAGSKELYDAICKLYSIQPTIGRRSADRIKMQQYSTPLPMSFLADMFAYRNGNSVLEPTAGNGMLVFAVPANVVCVNELDKTRLANLRGQGFAKVTNNDANKDDAFHGMYDTIISNPPFGNASAREYDGKIISGLEQQIALNALSHMKDNGRAAIIIGGNMEYRPNGAVKDNVAFWTYLYNHYNVKGVVDMDGQLYAKQGTTFPTRMILIDGRRSEEEIAQATIYPPTEGNALVKAETFDDLYNIVKTLNDSNSKTNGTEILRTSSNPMSDDNTAGTGTNERDSDRKPHENVNDGSNTDKGKANVRNSNSGNRANEPARVQKPAKQSDEGSGKSGNAGVSEQEGGITRGSTDRVEGSERAGDNGRVQPAGVHAAGNRTDGVGITQPERKERTLTEEKLPYRPHNTAFSLQSVAPAAMVEAMDNCLSEIERETGKSIDDYVTDELGYDTIDEMHNAIAAEQVDSVAMAIYQMNKGFALIIGDQTGVGKGRQMAALIRWASKKGKKPIFITQKDDLFTDIYRDLVDVGSGDLRPFIFNASNVTTSKKDGKEVQKCTGGVMLDANGKLVYRSSSAATQAKVFESGKLPEDCDYAVLTYSQVNTGDEISIEEAHRAAKADGKWASKKQADKKKSRPTPKATFLRKIAKDNYLFLDESHTAAGDSNVGAYIRSIIGQRGEDGVKAVTFASATFAKRPDTMPMYAMRTAMSQANVPTSDLIGIIEKGGVTLQEIMSRALTESGQMVRRERDMSDVKTDWITVSDEATVKRARDNYDKAIRAFNAIIKFQEFYVKPMIEMLDNKLAVMASTAGVKQGTNKMGVENVPFASKTYNYTKQLMLALKVDAIVDKVAEEIEAGRHPVIALESTMEASLNGYSVGDVISEPTFSASLMRGLDSVMQYTIKDENGEQQHSTYKPYELGEEGERRYYDIQNMIRESTKDIFISPLDAIIEKLNAKGYRVGELTGRSMYVERNDDGQVVVRRRTDKDKKRMQRDFNSGVIDVLILNKSASTGISLHASSKFSDQRQRSMIIAQPLSDINDYMQMIGRIDRTGQVSRGYYINLGLPVPAESRFLMMLSTKLKSLNANTTTSQDNEGSGVEAPDLLNKYGSKVVVEYLRDNPEIYNKMGEPIAGISTQQLEDYTPPMDDSVVRKVTGYVALLNTEEQEAFYKDVVARYNDLISYLNSTGSNDLKITVMPLKAKTLSKNVSSNGVDPNGNNLFAQNAYIEEVEMDILRKPMKAAEIQKTMENLNKLHGTEKGHFRTAADENAAGERVMEIVGVVEREADERFAKEDERYENAKNRAQDEIDKFRARVNSQDMDAEQKKAEIRRFTDEREEALSAKHAEYVDGIKFRRDRMKRSLQNFRIGQTYFIPMTEETDTLAFKTHAIFCGYKVKDSGITPSTSFAVFATLDGRRRVEVKLSDITMVARIADLTDSNYNEANEVTLENWDSQIPNESRKKGYIMTGNILQAIADTKDEMGRFPGQLISYTDDKGGIHDGILMPDQWNPTQLRNSGVPFNAVMGDILGGRRVKSIDGKVEVYGSHGMFVLSVPKSKKEGAMFYDNDVIKKNVEDGAFWQNKDRFMADIDGQENLKKVLEELAKLGVRAEGDSNTILYRDDDYLSAVNSGDKDAIKKAIIDAAEKAMPFSKVRDKRGNLRVMYHGTTSKEGFNEFDSDAIYMTSKPSLADQYTHKRRALSVDPKQSGRVMPVFVNIERPYVVEANRRLWDNINVSWSKNPVSTDDIVKYAKKHGYDGVIIKNVRDNMFNNDKAYGDDVIAFSSSQVKATGASYEQTKRWHFPWDEYDRLQDVFGATYDEEGNLIPLSERFNTSDSDIRYRTSEELNNEYGSRWLDEQTNEDGRHTTQVKNTINSYRKFGEFVKRDSNGRDVSVLDASSGLGLGTEWMRENGINVDDVEPFPSENRTEPTYKSYDDIDKKYDYIISNAVLNVIPDDWRANVLHDMADKLKQGGKLVINVRGAESIKSQGVEGKTRTTLDDKSEILVHRPDGSIKAYQKGFTKAELKEWCQNELGEGYSVENATNANAGGTYDTAVVVTKLGNEYRDGEGDVLNTEESRASSLRAGYTERQHKAFIKRQKERMRDAAMNLAEKMNIADNVEIIEDATGLTGRKANAKGWHDAKTGKIVIILSNNGSISDIMQTVLHEGVAHYGLRKLFGENFDTFLYNVFSNADTETRSKIVDLSKKRNWNVYTATEEYLARLAENTDFERAMNQGWWSKIKSAFLDMLSKLGIKDGFASFISDNELRYILWRSYKNLTEPNIYRNVFALAEDISKQHELKVGEYKTPTPSYAKVAEPETSPIAEHIDNIPVINRLKGAAIHQVVSGRSDIEKMRGVVSDEAFASIVRKYNKKGCTGIYLPANNLVIIFGDKVSSKESGEYTYWHEQTHGFTHSLPEDVAKEYGEACLDYLKEKEIDVYWHIRNEYEEESWLDEACSYMIEYTLDKVGSDDFIKYKFAGKDKIAKFVTELQNYLKNGKGNKSRRIGGENESPSTHGRSDLSRRTDERQGRAYERISERDRAIARDAYEGMMRSGLNQFIEATQDSMLGLKKLYEAIIGKGKRIEDVAGFENAYLAENRMSSQNLAEQHEYYINFMHPLIEEIGKIAGSSKAARQELVDYMMAKHGLERNDKFAERDAKEAALNEMPEYPKVTQFAEDATDAEGMDAYKQACENWNETLERKTEFYYDKFKQRDYAGLTALTGKEDVADAEFEARLIVSDYEKEHDTTDLWDRVREATQATLERVYKSGNLSKDSYERIRDMFQNYIPLQGWSETTSDEVYGYLTAKDGLYGSPIKHAKGRNSKADDPIATIAMSAEHAINQANRNLMKQRFLTFVENHPSDLVSVNELWLHYNDAEEQWNPVFPDLNENDTPEEVERKVKAFEAHMNALSTEFPDEYKRGKDTINVPFKVVKGNLKEHQVLVKRKGRTYVLTINGNPRAAQALNGLTNPDVETKGALGNILRKWEEFNRKLSSFYTTRNPGFVASNLFRDMLYSNCMTWVKESPLYALRFQKNFARYNHAVIHRLLKKWEKGTLDRNNRSERLFYQFMSNGGETGYTSYRDIEEHKKAITAELKKQGSLVRKAFGILGMQFDLLNRSVENCARFAAFVTSIESGRTIDRSIYDAKEVSVNFNKKGSGGKMVDAVGQTRFGKFGGYLGGLGRLLYVFWGAGVQGMTNFGRSAKRHPAKFITMAAAVFTLGYLQRILAEMMGGGDGDDDDKDAYYNLPEYVRRSNICIRAGENWITIPLPIELRSIFGLGELASGVTSGKEYYDDNELKYQVASQVSQILPIDMLEGGGGFHALIPSNVKPMAEAYLNKSWSGLPIYRENEWEKDNPEWTKAFSSTDQTMVDAARVINEKTGGSRFESGSVDINPARVEYMLNGYFGGYSDTASKLKKMAETAFGDREFEWRNMLVANRLIKTGDERTERRRLKNEYYKYLEEYRKTKSLHSKYKNAADDGEEGMQEHLDKLEKEPRYLRVELINDYRFDREVKALKNELEKETDPDMQKKIEDEMYSVMREMVDMIHELDKAGNNKKD